MKIRFWGVRGSFAMSGPDFLRYGGNTSSVEITAEDGRRLLVDLGTGATELAKQLMAAEFGSWQGHLSILLPHTHPDHIQGLPVFTPFLASSGTTRSVWGRIHGTRPSRDWKQVVTSLRPSRAASAREVAKHWAR